MKNKLQKIFASVVVKVQQHLREPSMLALNRTQKNLGKIMISATLALAFQACGSQGQDESQLHRAIGGSGATGGKCKVVSGPNAGKSGTYDSEGWCMGDWGGTECTGSDGKSNGKCQDAKKVGLSHPIDIAPIKIGTMN